METFNKKEFAELTKKAMAKEPPSIFAKKLQINQKYLETILNGIPQSPPKLGVINRISKESQGKVTCEELSIAAGYMPLTPQPEIKKLSERLGKWRIMFGREVNLEAFQEYLKQMKAGMTNLEYAEKAGIHRSMISVWLNRNPKAMPGEHTAEQLCDTCQKSGIDFSDFMKAAGYPENKYCVRLKGSLKPGEVKIPEEIVTKKENVPMKNPEAQPEKAAGEKKKKPASAFSGKNFSMENENITMRDLAELAVLRYLKQNDSFTFLASDDDSIIVAMVKDNGSRENVLKFDLRFMEKEATRKDLAEFYGECAMAGEDERIYLVTQNVKFGSMIRADYPYPANLNVKPKILTISGANVIDGEEI